MTSASPDRRRPEDLHPGRIALGYVLIGLAWIYGSGYVVALPIFRGIATELETLKGTGFVMVTAFGLYVLLRRRAGVISSAQMELIAVNEQRARLVAAVEQSAEAIVITDPDTRIIYVNPAFEHVSGYANSELMGANPRIVGSGQHDVAYWLELWATLLRGETWQGRFINRRRDGVIYEADSVITPVIGPDGEIVSYVGVQHDTTRERALERHLAESGRLEAIGQLAGGIAHDFNNLLTVIIGHAQLLSMETSLDVDAREDLDQIIHASGSAAGLVRQLLDVSRRQVLEPAVLDLAVLVEQLKPMLAGLLGPKITLVVESPAVSGAVFVDASKLEQVIVNFAVNARDAMPRGGTFTMTVSDVVIDGSSGQPSMIRPGRYSLLIATDTGSGMDDGTRTRVFEPFFTTKPKGHGTGLGLATAYGIVRQSDGYLLVDSVVGHGSTFTVYLPHHEAPAVAAPQDSALPTPGGTETILVVEDEGPVRSVIDRTLRQLGYVVLVAADATEAKRLTATTRPSLLVTDVRLPGLDGPTLAADISEAHPGLPVLFVSGYASETIIDRGELGEEAEFLAKPFTSMDLALRVRELLDGVKPRT